MNISGYSVYLIKFEGPLTGCYYLVLTSFLSFLRVALFIRNVTQKMSKTQPTDRIKQSINYNTHLTSFQSL